jgi:hypothetical protein
LTLPPVSQDKPPTIWIDTAPPPILGEAITAGTCMATVDALIGYAAEQAFLLSCYQAGHVSALSGGSWLDVPDRCLTYSARASRPAPILPGLE